MLKKFFRALPETFTSGSPIINICMAITTDLKIRNLQIQYALSGLQDVVITAFYDLSGTDTSYNPQSGANVTFNACGVNLSPPDPENYIAFKSLTKADVTNFMLATEEFQSRLSVLSAAIAKRTVSPTTGLTGLPWE